MAVVVVVSMPMTVVVMIRMRIVLVVAVSVVTVSFVLAVMVAVVMVLLGVKLIAMELMFPAGMPAPVGVFASNRECAPISEARIIVVVDVSVKANGTAEPRPGAEEDSPGKPLRSVIA